jgi:lysophospholipase L1-like esterase
VPPRLSRRARALALVGPSLLFLLALLGTEVVVRWRLPFVSSLEAFVRSPRQRADFTDRRSISIFEGDPLLFWKLKPSLRDVIWDFTLVSTNPQGLRGERPLRPKHPGSVRLVFLGDSVTFGYRVPVVFADHPDRYDASARPYPWLIEERLRKAHPDREIEAVILAVPGYSSHQGRLWLERDIATLRPDLVTVCFGWNDVGLRSDPDSRVMRAGWPRVAARRILASSQALVHASLWWERRSRSGLPPPMTPVMRVSHEEYVENHLVIADICRAQRTQVLVMGPVYRDALTFPEEAARLAGHRRALAEGMRAAGVPYLEIPALTEAAYPETMSLFGELIHPNAEGHRRIADALLAALTRRGMLGRLLSPEGR